MSAAVVHHVALGARDVENVAAFYERALGLLRARVQHDPAGVLRSVWLSLTPGRQRRGPLESVLMIERTDAPRPADRAAPGAVPGWFLLAFAVRADERASLEERIERAGAIIEARTEFSSYARDPEGNRFAISCYPLG